MRYHAKYYMAMAYQQLALAQVAITDEESKQCAKSIVMLRQTLEKCDEAKPLLQGVDGPQYRQAFDKMYQDTSKILERMVNENKTLYYELESQVEDTPKPDPQNFVKPISVANLLSQASPLDAHLRHLVPPQVREMQNELQ